MNEKAHKKGDCMDGIQGKICDTESALRKAFSKRKSNVHKLSVTHPEVVGYLQEGWELGPKMTTKTKLIKHKKFDELFEDRLWRLFYSLKFSRMNEDRYLKLDLGTAYRPKQIDVIAKDEDNIFVVECRSSESDGPVNAKGALEEWYHKRENIRQAIQASWGRNCGRVNLVVAVSSQETRGVDYNYAEEVRNKNLFLWSAKEIEYIESLTKQVGPAAKYQLCSILFAGKKQKSLQATCLAIKGNLAGHTFYTFIIPAKKLLKYAYVHHRELTGIIKASQVYQRMLRDAKLRKIATFVDIGGGFFPNSIIVNFSKPLRFDRKASSDGISMGTLHLPGFFGCAWIIDGQHRLYGVARAETDVMVPVLAFENIGEIEQANLFVDINEQQTSVPKNLLWDLYSDIYCDSSDDKQKFLYQVAETAKKLNVMEPFKNYIDIPSDPTVGKVKLSLTTVCEAISRCASCWDLLQHPTDESKTPEGIAQLIATYFGVIKALWPEDWEKADSSVLLSNNGFGVFLLIFRDIIKHLAYKSESKYKQKPPILRASKIAEFEDCIGNLYLRPLMEFLKTDENTQRDIKTKTGRGPQNEHAGYLELKIQEFAPDFSSVLLDRLPKIPAAKEPPAISIIENKAMLAEGHLRLFVLENLKRFYGSSKWWKQGLPGSTKTEADKRWQAEIDRKAFLKRERRSNDDKFVYLGLGDLMSIILYGQNWETFKDIFQNKKNVERRIKDVMALRNPTSHSRRPDDQDVLDGMSGLLWLSRCIDDNDLNPYT